ncbi:hypothetical protein GCM10028808_73060 [Spirosoma migulaei]
MIEKLIFLKVNELPDIGYANAVYFVPAGDYVEWYVSSKEGVLYKIGNTEILNEIASLASTTEQSNQDAQTAKNEAVAAKDIAVEKASQVAANMETVQDIVDSIVTVFATASNTLIISWNPNNPNYSIVDTRYGPNTAIGITF